MFSKRKFSFILKLQFHFNLSPYLILLPNFLYTLRSLCQIYDLFPHLRFSACIQEYLHTCIALNITCLVYLIIPVFFFRGYLFLSESELVCSSLGIPTSPISSIFCSSFVQDLGLMGFFSDQFLYVLLSFLFNSCLIVISPAITRRCSLKLPHPVALKIFLHSLEQHSLSSTLCAGLFCRCPF